MGERDPVYVTSSRLGDLRERQSIIPWYRRRAFLSASLGLLVVCGILLPAADGVVMWQKVYVGLFFFLALAWGGLVLSDAERPDFLKTAVAFGLLVLGGWLFYRYSDADWERLIHVFFNWRMMSQPMEGDATGWDILLAGLWLTVQLAFFSAVFSTILGLLLAVFRSFGSRILNLFILAYIDFFRSMPIIVLMVLIYFALPYTGVRLSARVSGILALSLNSAAYVSEIFRAGISSVKHGQIEAARALGLTPAKTMRLIILPQAFRVVIPPLASNYVASTKDTAIASSISILELLKSAMQLQAWRANPTPIIAATGIYILLLVPLTRLSGVLERKMRVRKAG
ncbi:MAG: amino acid ABC transporter permease [Chloroflexota bacterium]